MLARVAKGRSRLCRLPQTMHVRVGKSPEQPGLPDLGAAIGYFCDQFLVSRQRSPTTAKAYRCDLGQFASIVGQNLDVAAIDRPHVERWIAWLRQKNSKPSTIRRKLACLRSFLRFQRRRGALPRDPFDTLEVDLRDDRELTKTLTDREFESLLATADRIVEGSLKASSESLLQVRRDQAIIWLFCGTGLRVGELVAMKLDDVNLAEGILRVNGKGRRQRLAFTVNGDLERLTAYVEARTLFRFGHDGVFVNHLGRPLSTEGVRLMLARVARLSGIQRRVTPHMLRHTAATRLLQQGANLRIVQDFLGHSSIRMTERYTHVSATVLRRAVAEHSPLRRLPAVPSA